MSGPPLMVASAGAVVVWLVLAALVVAAIATFYRWERYRPRVARGRTRPTTEVFVDPETGRRVRVWLDPATGTREYHDEPDTTARTLPPPDGPGLLPDAPGRPDDPRRLPPAH